MEIEIRADVTEFSAEYADCGSHRLRLKIIIDNDEAADLANQITDKLKKLKEPQ